MGKTARGEVVYDTRLHRVVPFPETIAVSHGGGAHVADEQASYSGWDGTDECGAPEGGKYAEPVATRRFSQVAPAVAVVLLFAAWMWEEHKPTLLLAAGAFSGVIGFAVWVRWPVAGV